MRIKEMMESGLFDENEQVVVLYSIRGDINNLRRLYEGRLVNVPIELHDEKIEQISSMGEYRRNKFRLNKYGWLEVWIEKE